MIHVCHDWALSLRAIALAILLFGCHTPAPVPADPSIGALDFIVSCRDAAGWNFTYESRLEGELEQARVTPFDPEGLDDVEFLAALNQALTDSRFHAERVGPASLKTVLLRQ